MWRSEREMAEVQVDLDLITPIHVQVRAHDLLEAGEYAAAVELIRKESQVSRWEAEEVAKALQAGHVLPDFPMPWEGDLSTRVRKLVTAGRRKEAVFLVRSHEDMSRPEAEAFVDAQLREPGTQLDETGPR